MSPPFSIALRFAAAIILPALVACGGSGGGDAGGGDNSGGFGPGKVDPGYGDGGRTSVAVPAFPNRMAVAADGSVYIAGCPVAKRDANGIPAAFAFDNPVRCAVYGSPRFVDPDGSVYLWVGGALAKVDSTGNLVASFGANGYASSPNGVNIFGWSSDVVRDASGNIYVAAAGADVNDIGNYLWNLAKFDRDGRAVASFGTAGRRTLVFRGIRVGYEMSLAVDSGGNVYIASSAPGARTMLVAKLDSAGNLASDFSMAGMWLAPGCDTSIGATAIALDASGNILVAGDCPQPGDALRPKIFKLDPRGNVISSFRDAGLRSGLFGVTTAPAGREPSGKVRALLVSSSGDIYAAGSRILPSASCRDFAVAKLGESGEPARGFGENGIAVLDVVDDELTDVQMDRSGRLYVGGESRAGCDPAVGSPITFVVYRLGA